MTRARRIGVRLEVTFVVQAGNGGALHYDDNGSGGLAVISCLFTANIARSGGALHVSTAASVTITECDFSVNRAGRYGGSAYIAAVSVTATATQFRRSSAGSGGALFVSDSGSDSDSDRGEVVLAESEFSLNRAQTDGGGAFFYGLTAVTAIGCLFESNSGPIGYIVAGTPSSGGALYVYDVGSVTLTGSNFTLNNAPAAGGAVYLELDYVDTLVNVTHCRFTSNTATYGSGGGLYVNEAASVVLMDCEFSSNNAFNGEGGAAYFNAAYASVSVTGCRLSANNAGEGGAVYVTAIVSMMLMLTDCEFSFNVATSNNGGAVYLDVGFAAASVTARSLRFTANQASDGSGGAVYASAKNTMMLLLVDCEFSRNSAGFGDGGAVHVTSIGENNDGYVGIAQSLFEYNTASIGGAVFCGGAIGRGGVEGRISLDESRFYENSGSQAGGAVFLEAAVSTTHVSLCEFRGNRVQQTVDSTAAVGGAGGALYVQMLSIMAYSHTRLVRLEQSNFTDNSGSGMGGAIFLLASITQDGTEAVQLEVELTDCRLVNSTAAAGGAVYAENIHRLSAVRTVFAGSSAVGSAALGGALLVRRVPRAQSSLQLGRRLLSHPDTDTDSATDYVYDTDYDDDTDYDYVPEELRHCFEMGYQEGEELCEGHEYDETTCHDYWTTSGCCHFSQMDGQCLYGALLPNYSSDYDYDYEDDTDSNSGTHPCVGECQALDAVRTALAPDATPQMLADACNALRSEEVQECYLSCPPTVQEHELASLSGIESYVCSDTDVNSGSDRDSDGGTHPCLAGCRALDPVRTARDAWYATPQILADACDAFHSEEAQECILSCPPSIQDDTLSIEPELCGESDSDTSDTNGGTDYDTDAPILLRQLVSLEDCDFINNTLALEAARSDERSETEVDMKVDSLRMVDAGMRCGAGAAVVATPFAPIVLRVTSTRFQRNSAAQLEGGGMCIGGAVRARLEDTSFDNNAALNGGAVVAKFSSTLSVRSTSLSHNTATNDGGAILVVSGASFAASDLQFDHNVASVGAGLYVDASAAAVALERLTRAEGNAAVNNELVFAELPVHCTNCTSTVPALAACERWQSLLEDPTVQGAPHAMSVYRVMRSTDGSAPTLQLWGEAIDVANTERLGLLFTVDDVQGAPMCAWKAGSASATLMLHDMVGAVTLGGLDSTLVSFVDGAVDASQLIVEGAFNDTATLTVTMSWVSEQSDEFSVQRNVSLRVRPCLDTEYVVDGVCRKCGDGFLIQDPVSEAGALTLPVEQYTS